MTAVGDVGDVGDVGGVGRRSPLFSSSLTLSAVAAGSGAATSGACKKYHENDAACQVPPSKRRMRIGYVLLVVLSSAIVLMRLSALDLDRCPPSSLNTEKPPAPIADLPKTRRRVRFIPFPHNTLGSGDDVQCSWSTAGVSNKSEAYEIIQRASSTQGACIPPALADSLHVFSTAEAIECLSPTMQGRNISVVLAGDSYNMQLFVGLADIVFGRAWNDEITSGDARIEALEQNQRDLRRAHEMDPSFPDIQFRCNLQCYGKFTTPFGEHCSRCMNGFAGGNPDAVGVVGAGVHVLDDLKQLNGTIEEMKRFLGLVKRTILASVPSYEIEKVPGQYKNARHNSQVTPLYYALLPYLAPHAPQHPFVDFFQLTKSCIMQNCSYDGGHRARYVNRWKAQLLLNTICEVEKETP